MNQLIDHTILKADTTIQNLEKVCEEALQFQFCSVCVNGCWVPFVSEKLKGSAVKVCAVIGFPLGASSTASKVFEANDAVISGANEIDMVINVGKLKSAQYESVLHDIVEIARTVHEKGAILKVILETCLLTDDEIIKGCELSVEAGADFVKTSTGFSTGGATLHHVRLMRQTVGPSIGVKASGGVRSLTDARLMVEAGATRLGTSSGVLIAKEQEYSEQTSPQDSGEVY